MAAGKAGEARVAFDAVYSDLPGEPAARLALAAAMECTGDKEAAQRLYDRVWRVDRGFISAAFGLARAAAPGAPLVFALTFPIGVGMGVAGALVPVAVKEHFAGRPAFVSVPPIEFVTALKEKAPDTRVEVLRPGESLELD